VTTTTLLMIGGTALLIFWAVGAYNRLIRLKNRIAGAFTQIDAQLNRRHELIRKLVEAAMTYPACETETLQAVTTDRNQAKLATDAARAKPTHAATVTALAHAEQTLTKSSYQLIAVIEASLDMKADETMGSLQDELSSTDNKLAFARQAFNDAVLNYNEAQAQFPALVIARLCSLAPSAMLQA
jgi:LemA protein